MSNSRNGFFEIDFTELDVFRHVRNMPVASNQFFFLVPLLFKTDLAYRFATDWLNEKAAEAAARKIQGVYRMFKRDYPYALQSGYHPSFNLRKFAGGNSTIFRAPRVIQDGKHRTGGYYGRFLRAGRRGYSLRQDKKFYDVFLNSLLLTDSHQETSINLVPQGDGENERIGRQIFIKSIDIRMYLRSVVKDIRANETGYAPPVYRLVVYCDRQTNGAAAALTDLLDTSVVTKKFIAFNELANSRRFRILRDKWLGPIIPPTEDTSTASFMLPTGRFFRFRIVFRKALPIEFSGTTSTISNVKSNNIGFFILRNLEGTHAPDSNVIYATRIRYFG